MSYDVSSTIEELDARPEAHSMGHGAGGRQMQRYLIEVSHDAEHDICPRFYSSMNRAGAHFLTHSEWGCEDGVHIAWLTVEALDDEDAALIVPPVLRGRARIIRLSHYTPEDVRATAEAKGRFLTAALS